MIESSFLSPKLQILGRFKGRCSKVIPMLLLWKTKSVDFSINRSKYAKETWGFGSGKLVLLGLNQQHMRFGATQIPIQPPTFKEDHSCHKLVGLIGIIPFYHLLSSFFNGL
jgi:hypothetical protein